MVVLHPAHLVVLLLLLPLHLARLVLLLLARLVLLLLQVRLVVLLLGLPLRLVQLHLLVPHHLPSALGHRRRLPRPPSGRAPAPASVAPLQPLGALPHPLLLLLAASAWGLVVARAT
jgi:hypothetical protein